MNLSMIPRLAGLAAASLLLVACQGTSFETPPLAALPCDPALEGTWLSQGDTAGDEGEVMLRLDAACVLHVEERERSGVRTGEPVQVFLGEQGEHRYAWVDATWMHVRFREEVLMPAPGDVYVLRYTADAENLVLWHTNDYHVAHAIIDGNLRGEVTFRDQRLLNRIVGEPNRDVLDSEHFFAPETARFRRAPTP